MIQTARKRKYRIFSPLFIFMMFAFLYFPMIILIIFSFNSRSFPAPWNSFTTQWYQKLFMERELWESFFNSFTVASFSTLICLTLTCFMLYYLSRGGRIDKWMNLFYLNLVLPEAILGVALISYFGMTNIPLGLTTIIIAHSIVGLGFTIPIAYVRFKELDPAILEASRVVGATATQTFFRVLIPLIKPVLITSGLMIFIISFDDFVLSYFCSGAGAQTLSLYLIYSIRYGISPVVNALASILLVFTLVLVGIFFSMGARARRLL